MQRGNPPKSKGKGRREKIPLSQRGRRRSRPGVVLQNCGKLYLGASYLERCEALPLAFLPRQTTPAPLALPPFLRGNISQPQARVNYETGFTG